MTKTDHALDLAVTVAFIMGVAGFLTMQIWWIFGSALLIFIGVISTPEAKPELEDEPMIID